MEFRPHEKTFGGGDEVYTSFFSSLFESALHTAGVRGADTTDNAVIAAAIEQALQNPAIIQTRLNIVAIYQDDVPGFADDTKEALKIYLETHPELKK